MIQCMQKGEGWSKHMVAQFATFKLQRWMQLVDNSLC